MALSITQRGSSSSSSLTPRRNYDVFISFRGKDTRYNFTDFLFGALERKSIHVFRDDTKLNKGESIAPELLRAIEGSQVFVVVFSTNYASSTWCLRELEKILDCVEKSGKLVLPVFYYVDPSEVRHQKGSYVEAFEKHKERYDSEIVKRWRSALTQVANFSGWDIRADTPQHSVTQKIVDKIIDTLGYKFSSLPNDLVGIQTPVKELEKLLELDLVDEVRVVGISGMGGIGKTTLATALYERISHQFNACCFIEDLSRVYNHDGPIGAQKQILFQTQGGEHLQIYNLYDGANVIRSRLLRVKALIILDNVDQVQQLQKIVVNRECLGAGSRIIVISRDAHILEEYGVDTIFKVPILHSRDAYQLFCQKAFKRDNIMSNYELLAHEILSYANGIPLAIKVLSSSLYGRNISEWKSALARLRESPHKDIMDVLRLSFDGLEKNEKDIFLDISCFFNRQLLSYVRNIINGYGFHVDIGLRILIDKSLITIDEGSSINMHCLLEELGKNIICENSLKERKWSRLWCKEQLNNVMYENMENNVEAIVLFLNHYQDQGEKEVLKVKSLSKMSRLRLLINFSKSFIGVSRELRYIHRKEYPFMYLPSSFQPNQLVELILEGNKIIKLWKDDKYLPKLKTLDMSDSKNLVEISKFENMPNLELLILEGCVKLVHIDSSISLLRKLVILNFKDCKTLESIPINIFWLDSLKCVNLFGCSNLVNKFPPIMKCTMLPSFPCLRHLDISFCGLSKIPDSIGCLRCLESLALSGNYFEKLPSLKELSKLFHLDLQHCKWLKSLPELPSPTTIPRDNDIFEELPLYPTLGLYIFNCPKLGESKRSNRIALSWMSRFIKANPECSPIDTVFPSSKIPRWFNHRSVDNNSILHIDLSPIQDYINYIGVVCYVAFSVAPDVSCIKKFTREFQMHIQIEILSYWTCSRLDLDLKKDLVAVKSNHVWLCYLGRCFFHNWTTVPVQDSSKIKMVVQVGRFDNEHGKVKNFGCRLVFQHDLK